MLNEIRRVFRRSIEAFRDEVHTDDPEDQIAELLSSMRRELVAARAAIPEYANALARARAELSRERDGLAACERRGTLAARIDDTETVRIAGEFAAKHRERIMVLDQKVIAGEAELALRRREADEMKRRYQEADANRFVLLAQLRGAATRDRMRSRLSDDEGPMSDFGRMADRVEHASAHADALDELADLDGYPPPPTGPTPQELEERLNELKRRMGRE
ncbi:MAG: PspA/IM30 family protein [Gemmatimonadota bacterium]